MSRGVVLAGPLPGLLPRALIDCPCLEQLTGAPVPEGGVKRVNCSEDQTESQPGRKHDRRNDQRPSRKVTRHITDPVYRMSGWQDHRRRRPLFRKRLLEFAVIEACSWQVCGNVVAPCRSNSGVESAHAEREAQSTLTQVQCEGTEPEAFSEEESHSLSGLCAQYSSANVSHGFRTFKSRP